MPNAKNCLSLFLKTLHLGALLLTAAAGVWLLWLGSKEGLGLLKQAVELQGEAASMSFFFALLIYLPAFTLGVLCLAGAWYRFRKLRDPKDTWSFDD